MILRRRHVAPAAHVEVGISAHSQIRTVHVFMGTIGGKLIGTTIKLSNVGTKSLGIEFDDPRYAARIAVRMRKMRTEPVFWNVGVGVGVGKPNVPWIEVPKMIEYGRAIEPRTR
jgi:hypothetical protein